MEVNKCINCEQEVQNNFCSNCGQRSGVKRITLREGWNDFWARIYGFDGMFPRTLRDLTVRPGKAAKFFIQGNRVKYYGPVGYFFLMTTVLVILLNLLHIEMAEFLKNMGKANFQPEIKPGSGQHQFQQLIFGYISDNFKFFAFGVIPFQALFARFVFFRKSGLNYVEQMVLPLYTQGHIYWISILTAIIYKSTGFFMSGAVASMISMLYFCFAYSNFITYQSKWKSFLKGLGIFYLSLLSFIILIGLIIGVMLYLNPEFIELIRPSNNT